jgi:hypothetical protein
LSTFVMGFVISEASGRFAARGIEVEADFAYAQTLIFELIDGKAQKAKRGSGARPPCRPSDGARRARRAAAPPSVGPRRPTGSRSRPGPT